MGEPHSGAEWTHCVDTKSEEHGHSHDTDTGAHDQPTDRDSGKAEPAHG